LNVILNLLFNIAVVRSRTAATPLTQQIPPQLGTSIAYQSPSSSPRPSLTIPPSNSNRIQLQPQIPTQTVRRPTIIGAPTNQKIVIVPQSSTRPATPTHTTGFVRIGAPSPGTPPVQRFVMLNTNPIVPQSPNQSQQ